MSPRQRGAVIALASIEFALTSAAAVDLWLRPQSGVRGHKALWWPVIFVQPVGPILYLLLGRHPGDTGTAPSPPAPEPAPAERRAVAPSP
ncbi:hypothetical protein Psi01_69340 [Planobispora siamensis]|uniref:Cardiolipin synthase N-terminal domain-containing protein n=2 Tax=Planobispora siamensis TaxID=936338 RepID=A0A8J3WMC4_9ACTN|nr:hypothetical protein Psi01_69340 [Planobispora siamensis]